MPLKPPGILGIVLTRRGNGCRHHIELAGFPHHSLETYLPKLVRAGQRVAICDQLEDPKTTKTIVKRGVTELVTPGVATQR
jgi:DNA mismatch repair protein MutS